MKFVTLGYIIDSFKLDGTFKVVSNTDFASLRYQKGNVIYLSKNNEIKECTVISYHTNNKFDFVKVEEINTKEEADEYKGYEILFDEEKANIPEGFYRYSSLINLKILNENKEELGEVKEVREYPAQVTLICLNKDKEYQVPFVDFFIKEVNIEKGYIIIHEIGGMRWK